MERDPGPSEETVWDILKKTLSRRQLWELFNGPYREELDFSGNEKSSEG